MLLAIAALAINVDDPQQSWQVAPNPEHLAYRDFIATSGAGIFDLQINVMVDVAEQSPMRLLMGGEQGISWFGRDQNRRVVLRNPVHGCLWDCFFETSARKVTVFVPRTLTRYERGQPVVHCPVVYPLDQCLLMYHMASRQGAIFHAAGAFHEGRGALFLGRSRTGKSTVSRQLQAHGGFRVVSDDRIIVRKLPEGYTAYGTPWPGEAKIARNESAPLDALFFLHKAPENRIVPVTPRLAFERLLPVASIPWFDPEVFPSVLEYLDQLTTDVPAFDLHFKPTPEIADDIARLLRSIQGSR